MVEEGDVANVSEKWRMMFIIFGIKVIFAFVQIISAAISEKDTCFYDFIWYMALVYFVFNIAVFVWFHVARWSHEGKVCSGDYLTETDYKRYSEFWEQLPSTFGGDLT